MKPDASNLIKIAGITTPVIGFYDTSDPEPFEPLAKAERCFFSGYEHWLKGESICFTAGEPDCPGGGYWVGGVLPAWIKEKGGGEGDSLKIFAEGLNRREGFKSSDEIMYQWFLAQKPYRIRNGYAVMGPLRDEQYEYLVTVTFYVNPDQLSLLLIGAEYLNNSPGRSPVSAPFGSGCGQMAAALGDTESKEPKAVIGGTDIAMRGHLPPDILAFTVNKPMFRQLCTLDEKSVLYKSFWKNLQKARNIK